MPGCPVVVRGARFPSIRAAAKAHGVTPECAHRHLARHGHLDLLGLPRERQRPDLRKPVTVFGYEFESVSAAAKALDVDRKTLRNMQHNRSARETVLRALMLTKTRSANTKRVSC
jgi:hypothetical protein